MSRTGVSRPRPPAVATYLICLTAFPASLLAHSPTTLALNQPGTQQQAAPEIFTRQDAELVLTLEEAIDLGLSQSFQVFQWQQQYLQQAYSREASIRSLRTRVAFGGTLPRVSQSISSDLFYPPGGGDPFIQYLRSGSTTANANLTISQQLITNGSLRLSASLGGHESFRELPSGGRSLSRSVQPSLSISFTQPLFQFNDLKSNLRYNELAYETLDRQYVADELARIDQITQQFYGLFRQQRSLEIQAESFRQSDESYQTGRRKYQAGLIAQVDAMDLDVQRAFAQASLQSARNAHQQSMYAFNRLVGLPLEEKTWVDAESTLEYRPVTVDADRAVQLALENRADVRLAEISLEQQELSLQRTISQGRPNLDMNVGYALTGNSTLAGLGGEDSWHEHVKQALSAEYWSPNTNVSLSLSIPVFDWGQNAAVAEGQRASLAVQRRQIEEGREDLRRDVINRVEATRTAMVNVENLNRARGVAEMSYEITLLRYERGEIPITDLLRSQEALGQAQNRYLDAVIAFENAKASLKEITLWDWETNQPVVPRTVRPMPFGR